MLTSVASNALLFRCIALISCVTVGSAIGIYSEILDEGHIKMYLCHTHCSSQWPPSMIRNGNEWCSFRGGCRRDSYVGDKIKNNDSSTGPCRIHYYKQTAPAISKVQ